MPFPYPTGPRPPASAALARVLHTLAKTIAEPEWDGAIRDRALALIHASGGTVTTLAAKASRHYSHFARKLSARTRAFTLADLVEVLDLLDLPPSALLTAPASPVRASPLAAHEALLGTTTDAEVARIAGCTVRQVEARRHKLGIARFAAPASPGTLHPLVAPHVDALGTMSDEALARRIGTTKGMVMRARVKLGIPSLRDSARAND